MNDAEVRVCVLREGVGVCGGLKEEGGGSVFRVAVT